ncbi:uncharacterized protein N7506_000128 [Penicillium brevicompactum]|uniref:uncharacterized protein n=1 Tax=Penicillium brevicompactum TaxID=5074 RepID=UPI00253FB1A3|nr:uncharacterized protein N7506_000128 [Penicillium brevicompactum]KAJ5346875.1 hypothetical protein N7506_000128 [Penicillium brevicompactum]
MNKSSVWKTPNQFLAAKTTLMLIDDLSQPLPIPKSVPTPFGNPILDLHGCTKLSLPFLPDQDPSTTATDPLNEATYFRAHRKFERQEKQLRNIERNRAQHEQQVLESLIDELRGQDWLRVMGLPSVHETEKNTYEPKREILVQELVTLISKLQAWKEEERRQERRKRKRKTRRRRSSLEKTFPSR